MAKSIFQESLKLTGLPGATAGSRYVGGTVAGAPTIGSFLVGDFIVDQTGSTWICTVSGSPGTWIKSASNNVTPLSYDQYVQSLLPTAWYKLSDPVGSTSAFDSSNNNASATVVGTATFGQTGPFTAVPLDTGSTNSSGSWIQSAASTPMTNTSVSIWFNMPSSINATLWQARSGSGGYGLAISNSAGSGAGNLLYLSAPFVAAQNTGVTVSTGWHNVVLVLDASGNQKIYFDGALVYSSTFSLIAVNNNYISIGAAGGASTFTSPIAQFIVFQQALNANQISGLYNASVNPNAQLGVVINENIAGKNFIINGGMDIAQRGTSFTIGNSTSYTLDRWSTSGNASSAYTVSQISSGLTGFQYAMRSQRNSGATSTANFSIGQSLETKNSIPLAGQTVTLSFWARVGSNYSGASGQLIFYAAWGTGTDQNFQNGGYTGQTQIANAYFTPTTSWQRFSYTGTVGSSATQVALEWYYAGVGTAGANDYFDITGVQLEIAPQATPFSRAGGSIGGELALCQRYYQSTYPLGVAPGSTSSNLWTMIEMSETNRVLLPYEFPVQMRTSPTMTAYSPQTGTVNKWYNRSTASDVTVSSFAAGPAQVFYNTLSAGQTAGNQMLVNFTASAEL